MSLAVAERKKQMVQIARHCTRLIVLLFS